MAEYDVYRVFVLLFSLLILCEGVYVIGFWSVNAGGDATYVGGIHYGTPVFSFLTAVFGILAFATKKSGWALAYTVMLSLNLLCGLVMMILFLTVFGVASGAACNSTSNPDIDCGGLVGAGIGLIIAVFAAAFCCLGSCCGCGLMYYKGLKREESVIYVTGAGTVNNTITVQGYAAPQQGYAPQQAYAQPQYTKDSAVPPVYTGGSTTNV